LGGQLRTERQGGQQKPPSETEHATSRKQIRLQVSARVREPSKIGGTVRREAFELTGFLGEEYWWQACDRNRPTISKISNRRVALRRALRPID
jgi:hypothetical protein